MLRGATTLPPVGLAAFTKAAAVDILRHPLSELRETAFLSGAAPSLDRCEGDAIRVVSRSPSHVVLDADLKCIGMVVLNDSYFPGWRARVDGRPAPLYEVDTAIQGVVAGQGAHRIDIRYVPRTVIAGVLFLVLGVFSVLALGFFGKYQAFGNRMNS